MEGKLGGKPVSASAIRGRRISIEPGRLNEHGTIQGGYLMAVIDGIAGEVANEHSGFRSNLVVVRRGPLCVTLGVDSLRFFAPVYADDELRVWASVNRVWSSSLEVGVRVCAQKRGSRKLRHVVSAYLTFVGVDDNNRPVADPVCPVLPETAQERRRYREADARRAWRLSQSTPHANKRGRSA